MRYGQDVVVAEIVDPKTKASVTSGKFIGRTLLYLGIGLLVTFAVMAAISIPLGILLNAGPLSIEQVINGVKDFDALTAVQQTALATYGIMLIISSITMFVMCIVISISMLAKGKVSMVAYIIYAVTFGVFLTSFSLVLPFWQILGAIGLTTLTFGAMALIGFLGGDKVKWFGVVGFGLMIGVFLLSLFNLIIFLISQDVYVWIYFAIQFVMMFAMLLITAFDFYRIKKIAQKGIESKDLALYCAFNLYVDFVYILIRILSLLARLKRN